ncbi:PREDICTED: dickkopf-related protein 1, partial [Gavialis gangeticus]|uniref:dickkopf-related protein 1 n=1 Tax=Gavialis gangeticus TaxID=94835 RepID=UPI00092E7970
CCCPWAGASAALGPGSLSSNAIKIPAPGGSAVSASPRDSVLHEGSNKYQPLDAHQVRATPPSEPEQLHAAETEEPGSEGPAPGPEGQPKRTTSLWRLHHANGQESSICLRSSDCAAGLCCARHFWSKICKPVLKEGQVCTKHRRKGSHGLEIFQRCYCGDGLSCRLQRDHITSNSSSSRLHTCQRH